MDLSILRNNSSDSDDNNKSRSEFRSVLSTSVEFVVNEDGAILASFHDLAVGILLIVFALPFFYAIGIWLGTNVNLSTEVTIIEHTTIDFTLQNHRIKDETAPCGAHKVRRSCISSFKYVLKGRLISSSRISFSASINLIQIQVLDFSLFERIHHAARIYTNSGMHTIISPRITIHITFFWILLRNKIYLRRLHIN